MSNFKSQLIHLGYVNPKLRDHLRPILNSINKKSGILEAPPALVRDVSVFISEKYAGHILAITRGYIKEILDLGLSDELTSVDVLFLKKQGLPVNNRDSLVDLKRLERLCLQYTSKAKEYKTKTKTKLKVNLDGWKTLKDLTFTPEETEAYLKDRLEIFVVIDFRGKQRRGGQWHLNKRELSVEAPKEVTTPEDFKEVLSDLIRVVRHESQHVAQDLIGAIQGLDLYREVGGLPSPSVRDPDYDSAGYKRDVKRNTKREHALRDVEFHPRLADEIDRFTKEIRSVPYDLRRNVARAWVGDISSVDYDALMAVLDRKFTTTREFFKLLKQYEPAKWKEAVRKFMNEIQDLIE